MSAFYDEDMIMQDADNEPEVRNFIRFLDQFRIEIDKQITTKVNVVVDERLSEQPIETMITEAMLTNVVERVYKMLDPIVNEELKKLAYKAEQNAIKKIIPPEMEGGTWSAMLRRLADKMDEG
jgi:hypothetical protein